MGSSQDAHQCEEVEGAGGCFHPFYSKARRLASGGWDQVTLTLHCCGKSNMFRCLPSP